MNASITLEGRKQCIVRIQPTELSALGRLLRKRYPSREWGSLVLCGTRRTNWGLAASIAEILVPAAGELDRSSPLFVARSQYLGRAKETANRKRLSVVVVHSHPEGYGTQPSDLDDTMDQYCASLYGERPYLSLILSWDADGQLRFSGRAYDRGRWMPVVTLLCPGEALGRWSSELCSTDGPSSISTVERRNERLYGLVGTQSADRVRAARLGIVGASGTGSPAFEMAVRAGFKHIVTIDPEREATSNLERLHGSKGADFDTSAPPPYKVEVMRRMADEIAPEEVEVVPIVGNILDELVLDHLLACDIVINCTDTYHSRAFLGHLSSHYLVPCLDVGVAMDGGSGKVTLQNIELTRFWPGDACAFCRHKIVPDALSWELMTEEERRAREEVAKAVEAGGGRADMYWGGRPRQMHTVGYLTTIAGSLAFGYALGAVTGTFSMPHHRFQFDIGSEKFGLAAFGLEERSSGCACGQLVGHADAARHARCVARPFHWPAPVFLSDCHSL